MPALIDLTGQRFGRLVVISRAANATTSAGNPRTCWHAVCDCGSAMVVRAAQLQAGRTVSCGCRKREAGRQNGLLGRKAVVTYAHAHRRLSLAMGAASDRPCVDCGDRAAEWSYIGACDDELRSDLGRPYCLHQEHYEPRCTRCHRILDGVRDGRSGRFVSKVGAA